MTNAPHLAASYLFADWRHIRCGDLQWWSPGGRNPVGVFCWFPVFGWSNGIGTSIGSVSGPR